MKAFGNIIASPGGEPFRSDRFNDNKGRDLSFMQNNLLELALNC